MTKPARLALLPLAALLALVLTAGPAAAATDKEIAQAGTITSTDLTGTWSSAPNDSSAAAANRKLARKTKGCKNYVAFAKTFAASTDAVSPDYSLSSQELSNHSYVYKTDAAAKKAYARAAASGVADCLQSLFTKQFAAQIKSDPQVAAEVDSFDVVIQDVPAFADVVGDQSVGYEGGIAVTSPDGTTGQLLVVSVVTRVGRVVLTYTYSFGPEVDPSTFDTALLNTVGRTQTALASD